MCSSASVFQIPNNGIISDSENNVFSEENNYIIGKRAAEKVLVDSGIDFTIIRPTYIYGENDTFEREKVIFKAIKQGIPICIPDKKCLFNPVLALDLAEVVTLAADNNIFRNTSILVGGIDIVSFEHYLEICSKICDKRAQIVTSKQHGIEVAKFPYLPVSVVVKTSANVAGLICFTPLEHGLSNVFSSIRF